MNKSVCALALCTIVSACSVPASENDPAQVIVSTCKTPIACSDDRLKSQAIAEAGGEAGELLIYDQIAHKTYHYSVTDLSGADFPDLHVVGAKKVAELSASDNDAVANFVLFMSNEVIALLNTQYQGTGRFAAYNKYDLASFSPDASASSVFKQLPNLTYKIAEQLSTAYVAKRESLVNALNTTVSSTLGLPEFSIPAHLAFTPDKSVKVFLESTSDNSNWGIVITLNKTGTGIETKMDSVVITDADGESLFAFPLANNQFDDRTLIGKSFYVSSPDLLRQWFQEIDLDLTWTKGCDACEVTITKIENPNVGVSE